MITIMRRYGFSLDFLSLWFIYGGGSVKKQLQLCLKQAEAHFCKI
jgi:hypothetical protein